MSTHQLPLDFDHSLYRNLYPDLRALNDEQLREHYILYGKHEGRQSNTVSSRSKLVQLLRDYHSVLEIGPFANPVTHGFKNVEYADVLSTVELKKRALVHNLSLDKIPDIDYVISGQDLSKSIDKKFDAVISSHVIEHQPDLVSHIQSVEELLKNDHSHYFLAVPDKRYCFDRTMNTTTLPEVIDAYIEKRKRHTAKCIIEYYAFKDHNNPFEHWKSKHEPASYYKTLNLDNIKSAIAVYASSDAYIDVHAWYFTPDSFRRVFDALQSLGLINMRIARMYSTIHNSNEFYVILAAS